MTKQHYFPAGTLDLKLPVAKLFGGVVERIDRILVDTETAVGFKSVGQATLLRVRKQGKVDLWLIQRVQ